MAPFGVLNLRDTYATSAIPSKEEMRAISMRLAACRLKHRTVSAGAQAPAKGDVSHQESTFTVV